MASITSSLIGALRRHPIWRGANDRAIHALLTAARDVRYRRGEAILSAGDPARAIHLLLEGSVRVFYPLEQGTSEATVKLLSAPAAFGDAECVLRTNWPETVEAMTPARVFLVDAARYFQILQSQPSVCFAQYWNLARQFGVAICTEKAAYADGVLGRLVALLVAYATDFGRAHPEGTIIEYVLTQDELATQLASNRRTVIRALNGLYKSGALKRFGRKYVIPDLLKLRAQVPQLVPDLAFRTDESPWAVIGDSPRQP